MLHIQGKIFVVSASFTCLFLLRWSVVPWQHYQPTNGVQGARVDKDRRPELSMGSYEVLSAEKVKFTQTSFAFYVQLGAVPNVP